MPYYSASTGSPLFHWVQTIFHQNYWQKVYIFRKQAFCRFCIWNCELIIQDVKKIYLEKRKGTQNSTAFISGGGGNLYSEVDIMLEYGPWNSKWTLNWDFGSTQKATLGFWQIFHTLGLKLGFLNSAKYHTLIKDMGSKSYPNPVFIAGKKHTLISYFYKPEKTYLFFLIFAVFDTLNTTRVVRSSPWETTPFLCFCTQAWYPPLNTSGPLVFIFLYMANSPVLQSARPRAVDSGEAKMRTASWENVDKQMPHKIRNNTWACFKWPKNVDKTTSHWNTQYNNDLHSL